MRLKKILFFTGAILSGLVLFAQNDTAIVVDTTASDKAFSINYFNGFNHLRGDVFSGVTQGNMIGVQGSFLYASSHVTNPLAFDFYQRKSIHGKDIQNSLNTLKGINTTGSVLNAGVTALIRIKENTQLTVGYEITNVQSLRYTEDLFKMVMLGNAKYEDKVAKAGNFEYTKTVYDKINIGIVKRKNEALNPFSYTAGVSVVRGLQYDNLKAPQLDIYTAPDGEYLEFKVKSEFYENKDDKLKASSVNGLGAALFGGINIMLSGTASFSAQVSDLGFVAWNKDMTHYKADTSFKVEPVEVTGLFGNSRTYQAFADSLKDLIYGKAEQKASTQLLPFRLTLNYKMQFNSRTYLDVQLVQYFNMPFRPRFSVGVLCFASSRLYLHPAIQVGGFSAFNVRLNGGYRISQKLEAQAGIFGLEALPSYNSRPGVGANAAVYYNF